MKSHHQSWAHAAAECVAHGRGHVIVTILEVKGSAPRDTGSKMLVTDDEQVGSIGGGHLEHLVTQKARQLLIKNQPVYCIEDFPLGAKLGQCCGGHVKILLECFAAARIHVAVFGAGHIGQALIPLLSQLPIQLHWIDSRTDAFPAQLPTGVHQYIEEFPEDVVERLPPQAFYVIMTHQHALDYTLVERILLRNDSQYLGVIGSHTKAKRFQMRLRHKGFSEQHVTQCICPMGLTDVPGKHPMEVAISVAAQIIQRYHAMEETKALTHVRPAALAYQPGPEESR